MATTGGQIVVTLTLDDKQYTTAINTAQKSADKLAQSVQKSSSAATSTAAATFSKFAASSASAFDSVGSAIGGVLKKGATLVAAGSFGIGAAAKEAWDQVSAVQQATLALNAYEKNGGKVKNTLASLVKYAQSDMGVLFNRKDLFAAAQNLKVMGAETDNLSGYVQIMSRSVGLGLSNWDDLNRIIGRVGSTGKLTGIDFDNLTKAGYKLDPSLRNAKVTWDQLFKALDKGIPADAMAGQASSIEGMGVRLQTSFRSIGLSILGANKDMSGFVKGGLGDQLIQLMAKLTETLKDPAIKEAFANLGKQIGQMATQALPILMNALKWLLTNIPLLIQIVISLGAAWAAMKIGKIASQFVGAVAGVVSFAQALKKAEGAQQVLNVVMSKNPMMAIATVIAIVVAALTFLQLKFNIFGKAWEWLQSVVKTTGDVIGSVFSAIKSWANDVFGSISRWINDVANGAMKVFTDAWNTTKDVIGVVSTAIKDFVSSALNWLGARIEAVRKFIEDHQVGLRNWGIVISVFLLPKLIQLGVQATVSAAKMAAAFISSAAKSLAAWAKSVPGMIAQMAKASAAAVVHGAKMAVQFVIAAGKAIASWVAASAKIIAQFVIMSVKASGQAIKIGAAFIAEAAKTAAAWAVTFVKFAVGMAAMVGKFLIQAARMAIGWAMAMGPIGLIVTAIAAVVALIILNFDKVKKFFAGVVEWIKKHWDLLLAILLGPIGIAIGLIIKNFDAIKQVIAGVVAWIIEVFNGVIAFFQGFWSFIVSIFTNIGTFIGQVFSTAWSVIQTVWNAVIGFFSGIWNGIVTVFSVVGSFFGGIFTNAWNTIKTVWSVVTGFFGGIWNGIKNTFAAVGSWFSGIFSGAANAVRGAFSGIIGFFQGIWNSIVNIFGKVGTTIGNAVGGAFKSVVNSVLGFIEGIVNTVIDAINGAINLINKLPGPDISPIGKVSFARLATGGVVPATPGGRMAMIGEGGQDEAVFPLTTLNSMIQNIISQTLQSSIAMMKSALIGQSPASSVLAGAGNTIYYEQNITSTGPTAAEVAAEVAADTKYRLDTL